MTYSLLRAINACREGISIRSDSDMETSLGLSFETTTWSGDMIDNADVPRSKPSAEWISAMLNSLLACLSDCGPSEQYLAALGRECGTGVPPSVGVQTPPGARRLRLRAESDGEASSSDEASKGKGRGDELEAVSATATRNGGGLSPGVLCSLLQALSSPVTRGLILPGMLRPNIQAGMENEAHNDICPAIELCCLRLSPKMTARQLAVTLSCLATLGLPRRREGPAAR